MFPWIMLVVGMILGVLFSFIVFLWISGGQITIGETIRCASKERLIVVASLKTFTSHTVFCNSYVIIVYFRNMENDSLNEMLVARESLSLERDVLTICYRDGEALSIGHTAGPFVPNIQEEARALLRLLHKAKGYIL